MRVQVVQQADASASASQFLPFIESGLVNYVRSAKEMMHLLLTCACVSSLRSGHIQKSR